MCWYIHSFTEVCLFLCELCMPMGLLFFSVGSKITNYMECMNGQNKICICDRQKMYYGEDPMACRKASENLRARIEKVGFELTNRGNTVHIHYICQFIPFIKCWARIIFGILKCFDGFHCQFKKKMCLFQGSEMLFEMWKLRHQQCS